MHSSEHGPHPTHRGELLARLLEGQGRYLSFLRARVRSGADAEDLLQQALVKAHEKLQTLVDEAKLDAWFFQVLRRTLADHHARWASRESRLEELTPEVETATPEEVATCACSLGLLSSLRREYVVILRRVDLEDEPLDEVAQGLGITVNNATVRLHRARKALREKLRQACGTDSTRSCLDCGCDT